MLDAWITDTDATLGRLDVERAGRC